MATPRLFFGCRALGGLLRVDANTTDNGSPFTLLATTDRIAPGGTGGECAFHMLYIPVEHESAVTIRVTPIVDGVALASSDYTLSAPTGRHVALIESPIVVKFPVSVANAATLAGFAARGTWLQTRIETVGTTAGYVAIGGVELEHEVLRSSLSEGVNK